MLRLGLVVIALALLAWGLLAPLFEVRMMYTSSDAMRTIAVGHSATIAWSTNPRIWVTAPGFSMNQSEVAAVEGYGPQPWNGAIRRIWCPLWLPAALGFAWLTARSVIGAVRARRGRRQAMRRGFEVVLNAPPTELSQRTKVGTNDSPTIDL